MQGLTDPLMRQVLTGVARYDWAVSEFIRVTQTLLPAHVFYTHVPELLHEGKLRGKTLHGTPVHIQLLGSDADLMAQNAYRAVELGAHAIDINFGCPAKTVNNHRGGAVLLNEPDSVFTIIHAVRQAVPPHVPVSAKIRLGYTDTTLTHEIGDAVQAANASWLTIHARTKTQGYKPPAYWSLIAPLRARLQLPIIANGEIWTPAQAAQCRTEANTLHLMLGRGAVTRPDLVSQIRRQDIGQPLSPMHWQDLLELQRNFLAGNAKNDTVLIGRYKQWLAMLVDGYPEACTLWQSIKRMTTLETILAALSPAPH